MRFRGRMRLMGLMGLDVGRIRIRKAFEKTRNRTKVEDYLKVGNEQRLHLLLALTLTLNSQILKVNTDIRSGQWIKDVDTSSWVMES